MKTTQNIFWLLLKLWLGVLLGSALCTCAVVGIMSLSLMEVSVHNSDYTYLLLIFYQFEVVALSIGALTLFLNCSRINRESSVCRFLSFFLFPLLMIAGDIISRLSHNEGWRSIYVLYPVIFSFLSCLTVTYILFMRRVKRINEYH